MANRGFFIVLEGIDGTGKTTMVPLVEHWFQSHGFETVSVRAPGGTKLGEGLREVFLTCKKENTSTPQADAMIMATSMHQLYVEKILPALNAGKVVIADRWTDSLFAYQGAGFGLEPELIDLLLAAAGLTQRSDLTILLDGTPAMTRSRLRRRNEAANNALDLLPITIVRKMRAEYRKRWKATREHSRPMLRVDANWSLNTVKNSVEGVLDLWKRLYVKDAFDYQASLDLKSNAA